jgi:[protein-PII] uridylyltransferase
MKQPIFQYMSPHSGFVETLRECFFLPDTPRRIQAIKKALAEQRSRIRQLNRGGSSGSDIVRFISESVDTLLRVLWDSLEMGLAPGSNRVALIAVGGYGRFELCPESDIDLLILTSNKPTQDEISQAETIIRHLWDFGFIVGHSVRSVSQCQEASSADSETWTSFLNERFVAGDHIRYQKFSNMMGKRLFPWKVSALVDAKIKERDARLKKLGSLVQLLEPDLKEGTGCLRDVHSMMWIAKVKHHCDNFEDLVREGLIHPQELEDLRAGYEFLLQVRCALHFLTGKKDDRLSFHLQPELAAELGFTGSTGHTPVEAFLRVFYHHTKAVNRLTESVVNRWSRPKEKLVRPDRLRGHAFFTGVDRSIDLRVSVGNPFIGDLGRVLEFFDLANTHHLEFSHHSILRLKQAIGHFSTQRPEAMAQHLHQFLALCQRSERVGRMLRCMSDVGLVALLIPDFAHIYCHSQHDIYHIYTTDEHTLTVVRQLAYLGQTDTRELASLREALQRIKDRDLLVVACIFHDIGKGVGPGHSLSGSKMVFKFLEEMGFSASRCLTASNLVLHHLLMNETIQRRDLEDPKTIHDFTAKVESPAFLHMLYVLTYCDVSSVHPDAWSNWKASLLRQLYEGTLLHMQEPYKAAQALRPPPEEELVNALHRVAPMDEAKRWIDLLPDKYLANHPPQEVARDVQLLKALPKSSPGVRVEAKETHWEVTVAFEDAPALLSRIAGTLARLELSILGARLFSLSDGTVLDKFRVANPPKGTEPSRLGQRLTEELKSQFKLSLEALAALRTRFSPKRSWDAPTQLPMPPEITVSNEVTDAFTVVDVTCLDRIGLLYQVALCLSDMGLSIHAAILTGEADKAMDSFYLTHNDGSRIESEEERQRLIEELSRTLSIP